MAKSDRPGGHTGIYLSASTRETLERLKTWPAALLRELCVSIDAGEDSISAVVSRAQVAQFRRKGLAGGPRYSTPSELIDQALARASVVDT